MVLAQPTCTCKQGSAWQTHSKIEYEMSVHTCVVLQLAIKEHSGRPNKSSSPDSFTRKFTHWTCPLFTTFWSLLIRSDFDTPTIPPSLRLLCSQYNKELERLQATERSAGRLDGEYALFPTSNCREVGFCFASAHTHTHAHTRTYIHLHIHTRANTCTHTNAYTHKFKLTYTHSHTPSALATSFWQCNDSLHVQVLCAVPSLQNETNCVWRAWKPFTVPIPFHWTNSLPHHCAHTLPLNQ